MLRGEPLDGLARELGVTAAILAQWREQFLAGGQTVLKSRPADERDDEIQRLRAKVGEITMNNELLLERAIGWRRTCLYRGGGRANEPDLLALHAVAVRSGAGVPGVGDGAVDGVPQAGGALRERLGL